MNTFSTTEQNKRNNIFFILSGIFITNAIIAEILGTKIFEFDFILNFNMSVGVIIWPVVFITTDIINEYFGKKGIKKISYFTILLIIYVFIIIYMSTKLTPNNYWLNINSVDNHGNPFNIDYAYNIIAKMGKAEDTELQSIRESQVWSTQQRQYGQIDRATILSIEP